MSLPIVDVGIACAPNQTPDWWGPVFANLFAENGNTCTINAVRSASSALPDFNKNKILISQKRRGSLTDANRTKAVDGFLGGTAEWMFWMDDDTVPPTGVIGHLLSLKRQFVAGLYFLGGAPNAPVAYHRNATGHYYPLWNYPQGELVQVDSVGMGCTLIHREVYEKIRREFRTFQRPDGTVMAIHKSQVRDDHINNWHDRKPFIKGGVYHMPVTPVNLDDEDDLRSFPFYVMENCRTEDHYFCEMAEQVGFKPWVDTTIKCEHVKPYKYTELDYLRKLNEGARP